MSLLLDEQRKHLQTREEENIAGDQFGAAGCAPTGEDGEEMRDIKKVEESTGEGQGEPPVIETTSTCGGSNDGR
jgi:hypothetical protein